MGASRVRPVAVALVAGLIAVTAAGCVPPGGGHGGGPLQIVSPAPRTQLGAAGTLMVQIDIGAPLAAAALQGVLRNREHGTMSVTDRFHVSGRTATATLAPGDVKEGYTQLYAFA